MGVLVDQVKTSFSNFFTIQLEHPLYETLGAGTTISSLTNDFYVEPDKNTRILFNRYPINYLFTNNTLTCYIRTNEAKLFLPLPGTEPIRFLVKTQSRFTDRTLLKEDRPFLELYYFTNKNRTGSGDNKHLTSAGTGVTDADLALVSAVQPSDNCFAVIDVQFTDTGNDYRLLNASGELMRCRYRIKFHPKFT